MSQIRRNGFSLVELLAVLAIIGIISGIAIPAFMGHRARARMIGDAQTNAQVLAMQLESRRADMGVYGTPNVQYGWSTKGALPSGYSAPPSSFLPTFTPTGNSKMNFGVAIGSTGITYTIRIFDPSLSTTTSIFRMNQSGSIWKKY